MEKYSIEELLSIIEKNNADERSASQGYYELLDAFHKSNLKLGESAIVVDAIEQIKEIISDEMQHSQVLTEMAIKLSGIYPAKD